MKKGTFRAEGKVEPAPVCVREAGAACCLSVFDALAGLWVYTVSRSKPKMLQDGKG